MIRLILISLILLVAQYTYAQTDTTGSDIEACRIEYLHAVEQNDQHQIVETRTNLAIVYWYSKNYSEALKHFKGAAATAKSINDVSGEINIQNYLSMLYCEQQNFSEAKNCCEEALKLSRNAGLPNQTITSQINLAAILRSMGDNQTALQHLTLALDFASKLGNNLLKSRCCKALSQIYADQGETETSQVYLELSKKAEDNFKEEELIKSKQNTQNELNIVEKEVVNKEKQLAVLETQQQETLDSLMRIEMINKQMSLEMELIRREREVAQLKIREKENQIAEAERFQRAAIIVISIITVLLALLLKFLTDRNRANRRLSDANSELKAINETVKLQNHILNSKAKQIESQRNELERKNNQIIDSISSASRIQNAMLPSLRLIKSSFEESFVYFAPRDIVSGDFYWFADTGRYRYLAVIDCVGHSLQGAFISVVANSLLNEIIRQHKDPSPADILGKMNVELIKTWSDDAEYGTSDHGMDMSLCRFDNLSDEITIAAANHTVWAINNDNCTEIQGDIYSIGASFSDSINSVFTNHTITNSNGTTIYMFSDGFQDQFGGEKGKKYMQENLKKLIISIQDKPLAKQYDILGTELETWKNGRPQTDDILVIGVKNRLIETLPSVTK